MKKVKAVEVYAKAKKDEVIQNMAAEQKIRTQRLCGKLIQDGQEKGEIAKPGGDRMSIISDRNNGKTLFELGISAKDSSTFQALANIPKKIFEDAIKNRKEEIAKKTENQSNLMSGGNKVKKTLDDLGISLKDSSTFQALTNIPKKIFEDAIKNRKEEIATKKTNARKEFDSVKPKSLSEIGISAKDSSTFQALANIANGVPKENTVKTLTDVTR